MTTTEPQSNLPMRVSTWPPADRAAYEEQHPEVRRFSTPNFAVQDVRGLGAEQLRTTFYDAAATILTSSKPSRSRSVALTELETAMMWAIKAYYGAPGE